ncbi:MAG: ribonuclease H-like domain-containing protein [Armatimonadota bacterium]|nr:ribonuclease H-like domain-containing protein [Armatimonadota bacterium]
MSSREELTRRIEKLNRGPLLNSIPQNPNESGNNIRDTSGLPKRRHDCLVEQLLQRLTAEHSALPCCEIEIPACELEAQSGCLHRRFLSTVGSEGWQRAVSTLDRQSAEVVDPNRVVFLDIETTGLADTPLFLIGLMESTHTGFVFRQYFARHYGEEPHVIAAASRRLRDIRVLLTFNGRSFDVPYIRRRAAAAGVDFQEPEAHVDLLVEARCRYRGEVPNCRLQTLEQAICGRLREDDIPSYEIPSAYFEYVETGNTDRIVQVIKHNLYDLLTMADLVCRMWGRE